MLCLYISPLIANHILEGFYALKCFKMQRLNKSGMNWKPCDLMHISLYNTVFKITQNFSFCFLKP